MYTLAAKGLPVTLPSINTPPANRKFILHIPNMDTCGLVQTLGALLNIQNDWFIEGMLSQRMRKTGLSLYLPSAAWGLSLSQSSFEPIPNSCRLNYQRKPHDFNMPGWTHWISFFKTKLLPSRFSVPFPFAITFLNWERPFLTESASHPKSNLLKVAL